MPVKKKPRPADAPSEEGQQQRPSQPSQYNTQMFDLLARRKREKVAAFERKKAERQERWRLEDEEEKQKKQQEQQPGTSSGSVMDSIMASQANLLQPGAKRAEVKERELEDYHGEKLAKFEVRFCF